MMKGTRIKPLVSDLCALAGCGLIVYGMYLLHPIAAIFTAGFFLLLIGFFVSYGESQ
jgi:hypothetical protein